MPASKEVMDVASPLLRSCVAVEYSSGALRSWDLGLSVDLTGVVVEVVVLGEPDSRFATCARTVLQGRSVGGEGSTWWYPLLLQE
jgi:hypothetical protein